MKRGIASGPTPGSGRLTSPASRPNTGGTTRTDKRQPSPRPAQAARR